MVETCRGNMSNTLVTIAVPIWNGAPFIERSINAIKAQTYKNIEVIIFDNGSSDNTYELLNKYIDSDSRFILVRKHQKTAGGPSRNEATKMASGKYICHIDVDDYISPTFVEKLLEAAEGKDFAYCDWLKIFPGGGTEERRAIRDDDKGDIYDRASILSLQKRIVGDTHPTNPLNLDLFSSLAGKMYRREIIINNNLEIIDVNKVGGADDALFNVDFMEHAYSGAHVNECLYNYVSNPNSYSHTQKIEKIKMFPLQYAEFLKKIKKYHKGEDYMLALNYRIFIQSFGAFIIASTSGEDKKTIQKYLKEYLKEPYFIIARKAVKTRSFSLIFKPFFIAVKKGQLSFALFYIKLALKYRDSK
jgi:glycosyltransferase involved in cell wall biosynthesis